MSRITNSIIPLLVSSDATLSYQLKDILGQIGISGLKVTTRVDELMTFKRSYYKELIFIDRSVQDSFKLAVDLKRNSLAGIIFITDEIDDILLNNLEKIHPSSYLIKPCRFGEIYLAVHLTLLHISSPNYIEDSIFIKSGSNHTRIPVNEIVWAKADKNYTIIYSKNGHYAVKKVLKQVVDLLPEDDFIRVHKSFLINKNEIMSIGYDTIVLNGKIEIPISRRLHTFIIDRINIV